MPCLTACEPGIHLPSKNWSSYNVRTIELLLGKCSSKKIGSPQVAVHWESLYFTAGDAL